MTLLEKITELRKKFTNYRGTEQDVAVIDGWTEEAKRLLLLDNLSKHDGVKYVREVFEGEIKKINGLLLKSYSKDLKDIERDRLLDKRDLALKYVQLFGSVGSDLEKLETLVDSEIH